MVAGLNLQIDVWRMTVAADDSVGGAMTTGTVAYRNLAAAIIPRRPTQMALEAGLETEAIYDLTAKANNIALYERDEIQIVQPIGHPLYGLRFRIIGVQVGRRRADYAHQHATLSRIRQSRR